MTMLGNFWIGPVLHNVILGIPYETQWKGRLSLPLSLKSMQLLLPGGTIGVYTTGSGGIVHLSALPAVCASSAVRRLKTMLQRHTSADAPTQRRGADKDNRKVHGQNWIESHKAAMCGRPSKLTPCCFSPCQMDTRRGAQLKANLSDVLTGESLEIHYTKPSPHPEHQSFVPRYRRAPYPEEEDVRPSSDKVKLHPLAGSWPSVCSAIPSRNTQNCLIASVVRTGFIIQPCTPPLAALRHALCT